MPLVDTAVVGGLQKVWGKRQQQVILVVIHSPRTSGSVPSIATMLGRYTTAVPLAAVN